MFFYRESFTVIQTSFLKSNATNLLRPLSDDRPILANRAKENLPIKKESCIEELRKGRFYFHGHDKEGHPVAYYSLAMHDPKNRDLDAIFRAIAYSIEEEIAGMEDSFKGFTIIWDTRNTTMKNTDNEFLKEFLNFIKNHYPEVMVRMIISPVGLLQRGIWRLCSAFLDERRVARIKMVGDISGLKQFISDENLIAGMGGQDPYRFDPSAY